MRETKILNVQWFNDVGIVTIDNGCEIKSYIKHVNGLTEKADIEQILAFGVHVYPNQLERILSFHENKKEKINERN